MSRPLPMLAHSFEQHSKKLMYPLYVQPKLNGVRCLATKEEKWSRNDKLFTALDHIDMNVAQDGWILDGELYCHGESFQSIISWVKRKQPNSKKIQLWVYDIAVGGLTFLERWQRLQGIYGIPTVKLVPTIKVDTEEHLHRIHAKYIADGFEGLIARNMHGQYRFGKRSFDLQKLKQFHDEEFEIVGGRPGIDSHEGCVVFECLTPEGRTFNVYPRGTLEARRQMYQDLDQYIGKMLSVRYQEKSEDGIPIFPIGITVRDYE